ncbi:hypothetical protein IAR55_001504 [Kwoniella newhampshirensis]|uniref:Transcriptional coactivator p15 (PC4) C-terminal domain-containing protein n=1 Tax=Kwoniella newhampshirensis TaxID=1651941 RepID=A0AAW0Z2A1_9TREE
MTPRAVKRSSSESEEDARSGSEEVIHPQSKRKTASDGVEPITAQNLKRSRPSQTRGGTEVEIEENGDGDQYFTLSEYRRLTVRKFKSMILIDVRETYKDKSTGDMKPGAKGISLTTEQWEVLKNNIDSVDDMVAKLNEK